MEQENINVSFTDFESVSIDTMKELWKDKDFTDVTLVTSDGRMQLKAHRIILSSASSVFNNIFREYKHQNPLIFLHDINFGILEQILKFIYTGKCEIRQDDLTAFLSCGTALGIQRLAGFVESKCEIEAKKIQTDASINTGRIIALDKSADDNFSEEMEHLRMGSVNMAQNRTPGSEDKTNTLDKCTNEELSTLQIELIKTSGSAEKTNQLDKCTDEENLEEMGSLDKTLGSPNKTVSIPNHISLSGNQEKSKKTSEVNDGEKPKAI